MARWGTSHAFGPARRTGGVDHIGRFFGIHSSRQSCDRLRCDAIPVLIQAEDIGVLFRQARRHRRLGEEDAHVRVLKHIGDALLWIGRIEGNVSCSRFEYGEEGDDQFQGAMHGDTDTYTGTDTEAAQVMGKLVGALVQFLVGESSVLEAQGDCVGRTVYLLFDALVEASVREGIARRVPLDQQLLSLRLRQKREARELLRRIGHDPCQQCLKVPEQSLDAISIKQICVVIQPHPNTIRSFRNSKQQIEFGRHTLTTDCLYLQPLQT